jgi:hypothetical protein
MIAAAALAQAHERLARSRQRLLAALGGAQLRSPEGQSDPPGPRTDGTLQRERAARSNPNSALHLALMVCDGALEQTASRHPWRLVLGAAAAGALVTAARPWRWIPQTLLVVGAMRPWLQPMLAGATTRMALAALASRGASAKEQPPV